MISLHPKYAFINIGVNDANSGTDTVQFLTRYQEIIDAYIHHGITPVLGTLTPQAGNTALPYNRIIRAEGITNSLAVVDIWKALADTATGLMQPAYNCGDNVHPGPAGNAAIAAAIAIEAPFLLSDTLAWNLAHMVASLPPGNDKVFTAAYTPDGLPLWSVTDTATTAFGSTPGNTYTCGNAICVDSAGNIYTGGNLLDAIYDISGVPFILQDAFVEKHSNSGIPLWLKRFGNNANDAIKGLTLDHSGNPIIAGNYGGDISIDSAHLHADLSDVFIARLDADGHAHWVKEITGHACFLNGISEDVINGSIAVTGTFNNNAFLDSISLISAIAPSFYNYDMFVARLSTSGNALNVSDKSIEAGIYLFPDPAKDILHISLASQGPYSVAIINTLGQVKLTACIYGPIATISINSLMPGIYYVQIQSRILAPSFYKFVKM